MAYAIIKTGGKQYKVSVGDKFDVEKLEAAEGDIATFDQMPKPNQTIMMGASATFGTVWKATMYG